MTSQLAATAPDLPVIDESRLLEEFGGDLSIIAELRDLFLEQAPPLHAAVLQAMDAGDVAAMARDAHSLKGACATYGAPRMAAVCKEVELAGKAGDLEAARAWRAVFAQEFATLKEGIAHIAQGA